jgi:hypothetical protein
VRFSGDGDGIGREDGRGVKQRAVMLAAVKAVAHPDAVGLTGCHNPHCATQTATRDLIHP